MHGLAFKLITTMQYALGESAATYKEKHWFCPADFETGARFWSDRPWKRLNSAQELMNKVGLPPSIFYNSTSISFCQNSL